MNHLFLINGFYHPINMFKLHLELDGELEVLEKILKDKEISQIEDKRNEG